MVFQYILEALKILIATCKDSERMLILCARHAQSQNLKYLLQDHATRCAHALAQLQSQAMAYGSDGMSIWHSSLSEAIHRGRLWAVGSLLGYDDHALLQEWERTQERLIKTYREILDSDALPDSLRVVIERQRYSFQNNRDQVQELRA